MKNIYKAGIVVVAWVALGSLSQARACTNVADDPCTFDGYSIVETERYAYRPHNQMSAAHWIGYKLNDHKVRVSRKVHHSKVRCNP